MMKDVKKLYEMATAKKEIAIAVNVLKEIVKLVISMTAFYFFEMAFATSLVSFFAIEFVIVLKFFLGIDKALNFGLVETFLTYVICIETKTL